MSSPNPNAGSMRSLSPSRSDGRHGSQATLHAMDKTPRPNRLSIASSSTSGTTLASDTDVGRENSHHHHHGHSLSFDSLKKTLSHPSSLFSSRKPHSSVDGEDDDVHVLVDDDGTLYIKGSAPSCQVFNLFKALAAGRPYDDLVFDSDFEADEGADQHMVEDSVATDTTGTPSESSEALTPVDSEKKGEHGSKAMLQEVPSEHQSDDTVKRWLHETVDPSSAAAGEMFTAASMNNFSPFGEKNMKDNSDRQGPRRPSLSSMRTLSDYRSPMTESPKRMQPPLESPAEYFDASDSGQVPTADDPRVARSGSEEAEYLGRDNISPEEKLRVIIDEFGDIASKMVNGDGTPAEPERLLAESQGSLFKGVMTIGNLHLTTYRMTFHALLPPDWGYLNPGSGDLPAQTEAEASARIARPNVMHAGPVTVHRHGLLKKRRVWMELTPEMITTYPSADEAGRVRPLFSILMSTALRLVPISPEHPRDFIITYDAPDGTRTLHFSVDTEQSAIQWRRNFESTLFLYLRRRFRDAHKESSMWEKGESPADAANNWTLLRCCVPLDRATIEGISDFHSFATLASLSVALSDTAHVTWHPEDLSEGSYATYNSGKSCISGNNTPRHSPSIRRALGIGGGSRTHSRSSSRDRSSLVPSTTTSSLPPSVTSPPDVERVDTAKSEPPIKAGEGKRSMDERRSMDSDRTPPRSATAPTFLGSDVSAIEPGNIITRTPRSSVYELPVSSPSTATDSTGEWDNTFQFMVAVLNDHAWFADELENVVQVAHTRHYRPGETPMEMVLDVGGYNCLARDDEPDSRGSEVSSDAEDEDDEQKKPLALLNARKAETARMAARVFGLREGEGIWVKRCYVMQNLHLARGHIIVTPRFVCFWRRVRFGTDIKYRYAMQDVKGMEKASSHRPGTYGLALKIHGHHDLHFETWGKNARDEIIKHVNDMAQSTAMLALRTSTDSWSSEAPPSTNSSREPSVMDTPTPDSSIVSQDISDIWQRTRDMKITDVPFNVNPALVREGTDTPLRQAIEVLAPPPDMLLRTTAMSDQALSYMPFVANRIWQTNSGYNVKLTPRRFTMLTIGSRGDVQPYIALSLRLMRDGHTCVIVTHDEFKEWIEGYGIEHRQAGGDPTALMKLSTEHRMFSPGFFKEALGSFRLWLDELLVDSWEACRDADVLIESPSAMAGVHIAERLKIPYFRAFTMPWTRTTAYPQAFMVPAFEMGPSFNYSTYVLFDNIMWTATSGQINRWRKKTLGLGATDQSSLSISKVPFLYNFSPAVVPKPLDWEDDITITGYWTLEDSDKDWSPPDSLIAFMEQAREDGKPLVYIGFGSIVVPNPQAVTKSIVKGVQKAGVRAIIARGWSARSEDGSKEIDDTPLPYFCYQLDKVPHGWLFPKIQAAMHHGGAGTTGASLAAGLPTIIRPWFGDQYFWATRVTKLGVGHKLASMRSDEIASALKKATTDRVMVEKASRMGQRIRSESGVDVALNTIHYNIIRALRDGSKAKPSKVEAVCNIREKLPKPSLPLPRLR